MTPERWAAIKEVFAEAVAREPRAREAFVAARCGADLELREGVERLLASDAAPGEFIDESPVQGLVAALALRGRFSGAARGCYRLGRRIATGGMGEVYEATDTRTAQRVAIKVLTEEGTQAQRAAQARSRACVRTRSSEHLHRLRSRRGRGGCVHRHGIPRRHEPRRRGARTRRRPRHDAVDGVAARRSDCSRARAQHRASRSEERERDGVWPTARLKVLDFGLARRLPREVESAVSVASLTEVGVIAGTLSYLAPELLKGERADSRSDIWAFGIILHELLTGRQPFEGQHAIRTHVGHPEGTAGRFAVACPRGTARRSRQLSGQGSGRTGTRTAPRLLAALRAVQSGDPGAATHEITILAGAGGARHVRRCHHCWPPAGGRFESEAHAIPSRTISIAVLPFRDASVATETGYFGDGVAEALIDRLGTIESLRVFSRESAMRFRDERALASIKRELSADMVVRGSLRRTTDRIRVTAELVDASTIRPVWQQTYERSANEILALENDIVRDIADRLGISLSPSRQSTLRVVRAVDPVVYEAYLKGRFQWNKRTSASLEQAVTFFSSAIERDPTYAPAHAALADCYNQLGTVLVGTASPVDMRPRAKAEAIASIQTDESLAEAHATLAYVSHYDWDWATADREFRRALELNPNLALAHAWYSNYLITRGRRDEAVAQVRRAEEIDPFSLVVVTNVGWTLSNARRPHEAIAAYRRALAIDPSYVQAHLRLGSELGNVGQFDEAIRHHQQVVDMTNRGPVATREPGAKLRQSRPAHRRGGDRPQPGGDRAAAVRVSREHVSDVFPARRS